MGCGCQQNNVVYVWTSPPDANGETYEVQKRTEIEVMAMQIRKGGSWEARPV